MAQWFAEYKDEWDKTHRDNLGDIITIYPLHFPLEKPPALVSLDDRAITFMGEWPDIEVLKKFKPWNKKNVTK